MMKDPNTTQVINPISSAASADLAGASSKASLLPACLKLGRAVGIKPGQKFEVMEYEVCLEFVPVKSLKSLRGTLSQIRV
jgi:hypothetical protein